MGKTSIAVTRLMTRRDALIAETRFDEDRLFPDPGRALTEQPYRYSVTHRIMTSTRDLVSNHIASLEALVELCEQQKHEGACTIKVEKIDLSCTGS